MSYINDNKEFAIEWEKTSDMSLSHLSNWAIEGVISKTKEYHSFMIHLKSVIKSLGYRRTYNGSNYIQLGSRLGDNDMFFVEMNEGIYEQLKYFRFYKTIASINTRIVEELYKEFYTVSMMPEGRLYSKAVNSTFPGVYTLANESAWNKEPDLTVEELFAKHSHLDNNYLSGDEFNERLTITIIHYLQPSKKGDGNLLVDVREELIEIENNIGDDEYKVFAFPGAKIPHDFTAFNGERITGVYQYDIHNSFVNTRM